MNKKVKVSVEELIEYDHSILRYDLMKMHLEQIKNSKGNNLAMSYVNDLLLSLNELSDTVDDLKSGVPVWSEIGKAFISDINNLWSDYQDVKKKYSL